jgi:hypothetical protein
MNGPALNRFDWMAMSCSSITLSVDANNAVPKSFILKIFDQ